MSIRFDNDPDVAIGITLPLTRGKTGYFSQSYTTLEQAKSNLKNLLLTTKGERIMQPTFGTDLLKLIFEQDDGTMSDRIRETIVDAVSFWMPYLKLNSIRVDNNAEGVSDDNNINRYDVRMIFSLNTDLESFETLTFSLDTIQL